MCGVVAWLRHRRAGGNRTNAPLMTSNDMLEHKGVFHAAEFMITFQIGDVTCSIVKTVKNCQGFDAIRRAETTRDFVLLEFAPFEPSRPPFT